jgi:hypothetical protein
MDPPLSGRAGKTSLELIETSSSRTGKPRTSSEPLVPSSRLLRRLRREVRFRVGCSGPDSNAGQIIHLRAKLVRNLPSAKVLQLGNHGHSHWEDLELRLERFDASSSFRARARPSSFCQTRYHHDRLPQARTSKRRPSVHAKQIFRRTPIVSEVPIVQPFSACPRQRNPCVDSR